MCVGSLCVGSVGVVMGGEDLAASWVLLGVTGFSRVGLGACVGWCGYCGGSSGGVAGSSDG